MKLQIDPPNAKQIKFFKADTKYIAFGGARGGGKSWAVRVKAVLLALKYPGIKLLIIRKTYPELRENHINPLISMLHCYTEDALARYNDGNKVLTFDNGSRILFTYCSNDLDCDRLQGLEVDCVFIDEATQQTEERFNKIKACVRGVNEYPKRVYLTCNPGGEGHSWVKRLFIDKRYKEGEKPEEFTFIQSLPTDNVALMESQPDYLEQLKSLPTRLRKMWLEGCWDVYEGQAFELTDDPEHYDDARWTNVINPFTPPPNWNIYRSYDFGYNKPASMGYWAVNEDGVAYRIAEYYFCNGEPNEGLRWEPHKQFQEIRAFEDDHPYLRGKHIVGVADPAIWDASHGESVNDVAEKYHILFEPGDNHRVAGWMQVQYRLAFDENGRSMMYIFNTCKEFIRTIPLMIYSKHKPEDIDTTLEDHIADETRYFCMTRPISPRAQHKKEFKVAVDPLNMR